MPIGVGCWVVAAATLLLPVMLWLLNRGARDPGVAEAALTPIPWVGRAYRRVVAAQWLAVARVGVEAGLPLPRVVELAGDAVDTPAVRRETALLLRWIDGPVPEGSSVAREAGPFLKTLPPTLPALLENATDPQQLAAGLDHLAESQRLSAERAAEAVGGLLPGALMIVIGGLACVMLLGMVEPLLQSFRLFNLL